MFYFADSYLECSHATSGHVHKNID